MSCTPKCVLVEEEPTLEALANKACSNIQSVQKKIARLLGRQEELEPQEFDRIKLKLENKLKKYEQDEIKIRQQLGSENEYNYEQATDECEQNASNSILEEPSLEDLAERTQTLEDENVGLAEENQRVQLEIATLTEDCNDFAKFVDEDIDRKLIKKREKMRILVDNRDKLKALLEIIETNYASELAAIEDEYFEAKNTINRLEVYNQRTKKANEALKRENNALNEQCGLGVLDIKVMGSKNKNLIEDIMKTQSKAVVELFLKTQRMENKLENLMSQREAAAGTQPSGSYIELPELPRRRSSGIQENNINYNELITNYEKLNKKHGQLEWNYAFQTREYEKMKAKNNKLNQLLRQTCPVKLPPAKKSVGKLLEKMKILDSY